MGPSVYWTFSKLGFGLWDLRSGCIAFLFLLGKRNFFDWSESVDFTLKSMKFSKVIITRILYITLLIDDDGGRFTWCFLNFQFYIISACILSFKIIFTIDRLSLIKHLNIKVFLLSWFIYKTCILYFTSLAAMMVSWGFHIFEVTFTLHLFYFDDFVFVSGLSRHYFRMN